VKQIKDKEYLHRKQFIVCVIREYKPREARAFENESKANRTRYKKKKAAINTPKCGKRKTTFKAISPT